MHMILRASGIEEDSLAVVRNLLRLCGNFLHWLGNRFGRFLNLNGEYSADANVVFERKDLEEAVSHQRHCLPKPAGTQNWLKELGS